MRKLSVTLLLLAFGCSQGDPLPKPVQVSGKIQIMGKPVTNAVVGYSALSSGLPARFRYIEGATDAEGNYQLKEVYPGEYMVCVVATQANADPGNGEVVSGAKSPLYSRMSEENPLRANVTMDATRFDFDLKQ